MRRLSHKKDTKKKERRNQIIVSVVLVLIMLFSVLGYSFGGGDEETDEEAVEYNGDYFYKTNNFWILQKGSFTFSFSNNPLEIEEINSSLNPLNSYSGKPLYIYSEDGLAEGEIMRNLHPQYNSIVQRLQPACIEGKPCEGNYPLKTCSDNFIIIKEGETNSLTQEENCVFIEGKKEDLVKISDEFLFKILGII